MTPLNRRNFLRIVSAWLAGLTALHSKAEPASGGYAHLPYIAHDSRPPPQERPYQQIINIYVTVEQEGGESAAAFGQRLGQSIANELKGIGVKP